MPEIVDLPERFLTRHEERHLANSGGFRTAVPVDSVQRFRRFSYRPGEVAGGPRVS